MEKKFNNEYRNNSYYFEAFSDEFLKDKDAALQPIIIEEKIIDDVETASDESKQKNQTKISKKPKDKREAKKSFSSYGSNIVIIQAKNEDNEEEENKGGELIDEIKKIMNKQIKLNNKSPKARRNKKK